MVTISISQRKLKLSGECHLPQRKRLSTFTRVSDLHRQDQGQGDECVVLLPALPFLLLLRKV